MKVLFVHPESECLGIEYLSAVLKQAGHKTDLVFDPMLFMDQLFRIKILHKVFDYKKIIIKEIIKKKPEAVCFSVVSSNYRWACKTAKEIKKKLNVPIIFGGIHPTSVPEVVIKNDYVDYVVVGEGEYALLNLVNVIESGNPTHKINNVWSKHRRMVIKNSPRELISNLDTIPFPDKEIFKGIIPRFFDMYTTITSRGCPHSCSYCNNSFMKKFYQGKGKYLRRRSVDNVIEELSQAKATGFNKVIFHDETFNHDTVWLREFSKKYKKEINLPFFCWISPTNINKEVVRLLKSAGCRSVEMGVQTHNKEIAKKTLKRYCSRSETENAIRLLKEENL